MSNNRIFYACHYVALAPMGTAAFTTSHVLHGVQSVGMTTNFNLEQAYELGQLSLYQNIEGVPDIEITLSKNLDGYMLLYHAATRNAVSNTLLAHSAQRSMLGLSIFADTSSYATGNAEYTVVVSGTYISASSFEFPADGNATESITLVANNKQWINNVSSENGQYNIGVINGGGSDTTLQGFFNGLDGPIANFNSSVPADSGSVQRRQHFVWSVPSVVLDPNGTLVSGYWPGQSTWLMGSVLPRMIPGISSSGTNNWDAANSRYKCGVQRIAVNANIGREALYELGHKIPFYRYAVFPVQVTCDIEILSRAGDMISATDAGILGYGMNLQNESIRISTEDGTFIDLGYKNKLSTVTYNGGDTAGGNVTVTYSYLTFNDYTVTHPQQGN